MQIPNFNVRVETDEVAWQTTGVPGVRVFPLEPKTLVRGKDGPREATLLIRMEPGHGYPAHRHLGVEEVLILGGGYRDEQGEHRTGDYLRYPTDSAHHPVAVGDSGQPAGPENPACILFAVARGGIEPA